MTAIIAFSGFGIAIALCALLAAGYFNMGPAIWPTTAPGSWQSGVFWLLFRASNISALALALASLLEPQRELLFNMPLPVRTAMAAIAVLCICLYGLALFTLGRPNTYCGREGLMRTGIYGWTRNPQYAAIIPFYAALALAVDSGWLYVLTAHLIAIFVLMALNEEPWLRARYGAEYDDYQKEVSRFFTFRRLFETTSNGGKRFRPPGPQP